MQFTRLLSVQLLTGLTWCTCVHSFCRAEDQTVGELAAAAKVTAGDLVG